MAKRSSHSGKPRRPHKKRSTARPIKKGADFFAVAPDGDSGRRRQSDVRLRQVPGEQSWELIHPRCARERREDIEEVRSMLDAGEDEIARDELRWLLEGCSDFIEAHRLLGELAAAAGDTKLARAHFGYAFDLGIAAIPSKGLRGSLPYARPANQSFFEAAKGLAWALAELKAPDRAAKVLDVMLQLDPSDPLGARAMREKLTPATG